MWKAALAGTAALAIVGSSLVYAQQRGGPGSYDRGFDRGSDRGRPNMEDMRAFADARLAALHAGLGLNADQEKNWPAFEQAAREMAKLRLDRIGAAINERRDDDRRDRQTQSDDPAERMHKRAAALTENGTALKKVADAIDPLYKSLDDGQKRRFAMLERMLRPGADGGRGREFRDRDGFDRGRDGFERGRDGRDGNGQRRFDGGPRRTDLSPQGTESGEERL
jgi:LTXXQ motif family protein